MNWKSLSRGLRCLGPISVLLAGLCATEPVCGQSGSVASSAQRQTSTPYTGDLSIFDSPGRDKRLQINRVMDMLGIESGKNVVDIGAGSGWFTVRAARRVTGLGTVYAVDINPEAIQYIDQRAKREQLQNVRTIVSQPDDPQLPADSIDAVLMLKTYHEVAHPIVLLRNLRPSLKPGAKIGIIDRNGNGANHGVSKDVVIREAAQAGYELRDSQDFVKADGMDYFLIFTRKPDEVRRCLLVLRDQIFLSAAFVSQDWPSASSLRSSEFTFRYFQDRVNAGAESSARREPLLR